MNDEQESTESLDLSPGMLADLDAISRGAEAPQRAWFDRPWKPGEPCWVIWVGPAGDVHVYPSRVRAYVPLIQGSGMTSPMVEVKHDPFPSERCDPEEDQMMMPRNDGYHRLTNVIPRIVPGEVW